MLPRLLNLAKMIFLLISPDGKKDRILFFSSHLSKLSVRLKLCVVPYASVVDVLLKSDCLNNETNSL